MAWLSINATSQRYEISAKLLRAMLARGELPGFYSGVKFLVDTDALGELLRKKSLESVTKSAE